MVAYVIVSRKVLLQCTRKEDFQVRVNYSMLISLLGLFVFFRKGGVIASYASSRFEVGTSPFKNVCSGEEG